MYNVEQRESAICLAGRGCRRLLALRSPGRDARAAPQWTPGSRPIRRPPGRRRGRRGRATAGEGGARRKRDSQSGYYSLRFSASGTGGPPLGQLKSNLSTSRRARSGQTALRGRAGRALAQSEAELPEPALPGRPNSQRPRTQPRPRARRGAECGPLEATSRAHPARAVAPSTPRREWPAESAASDFTFPTPPACQPSGTPAPTGSRSPPRPRPTGDT